MPMGVESGPIVSGEEDPLVPPSKRSGVLGAGESDEPAPDVGVLPLVLRLPYTRTTRGVTRAPSFIRRARRVAERVCLAGDCITMEVKSGCRFEDQ